MRPKTVLRIAYGLAAFVLVVGVVVFLATDRTVFLIFAAVGALTAAAGYLSSRGKGRDATGSPPSDAIADA